MSTYNYPGERFSKLAASIRENTSYKLSANGQKLIQQYHNIINQIQTSLLPIIQPICRDPEKISKQSAIRIISNINSTKEGNDLFNIMTRLDTLTNGGKTIIQGGTFSFNENDNILQYLEKTL